jgi:hypothetical protein
MYKVFGAVAAATMLAALALPGTAGAAQKQEPGVYKQVVRGRI